jgi:hypothetical protein
MGISSLKGTGSARRSFSSTSTSAGAGTVLNINGSGKLIALKITTPGTRTITISVDNSTYRTITTGVNTEPWWVTHLDSNNFLNSATCDISFSGNLTVSATGSVTVQFLYETEV